MRSWFAFSGLALLVFASFASPAFAEEASLDEAPVAGAEAAPSSETASSEPVVDECRRMSDAAHERVREFLERQRSAVEELLARHQAEHGTFHNGSNVSDADHEAFHERQEHAWIELKERQTPELEAFTSEAWRDYRERCEQAYQKPTPSDAPAECRERWADFEAVLADLGRKWEARHKDFQISFDAARAEFRKAQHSDEEWKAFEQKWASEARALFQLMEADMRAAADEAGLLRCWLAFQAKVDRPVPAYEAKNADPSRDYDEGARRIMERCQAKIVELEGKSAQRSYAVRSDYQTYPDSPYPTRSAETYTPTPTTPTPEPATATPTAATKSAEPKPVSDRDVQAILLKVRAACEAEMKAYVDKKHGERHGFGSFVMREEDGKIIVEGKFLSMVGLPERQMMTEIAVNDKVLIDALYANGFLAEFRPEQTEHGSAIMVFDSAGRQVLGVHDNPRAVIKLSTTPEIESLTLDLHDGLELSQDEEGIRFAYGDWKGAVLVHKGSVELGEGNVLTIHGKATFLVASRDAEKLGKEYADAVLEKKVGAEISVAEDGTSEATPLTDLEVKATKLVGRKLSANIDATDGEGKTVVFKVPTGLFKCDGLAVRLFAVEADGTESSLEIREASDLEDVLDPADDGADGFEYWCVSDRDGLQVLVSIAHFSEKRVEVESAALSGLPQIPGFGLGLLVAAAGVGLVLVGTRRRP